MKFNIYFFISIACYLLNPFAGFAESATLLPDSGKLSLAPYAQFWHDPSEKTEFLDAKGANFSPVGNVRYVNYGLKLGTYWYKINLKTSAGISGKWIFKGALAGMLNELHILDSNGKEIKVTPLKRNSPNFTVRFEPESNYQIYLKAKDWGWHVAMLEIYSPEAYSGEITQGYVIMALYHGAVMVMTIYNLFLFWSLRDKTYLLYTFCLVSFGLFQFFAVDFMGSWLFDSTSTFSLLCYISSLFVGLTFTAFTQSILETNERMPRWNRLLRGLNIYYCLLIGISPILSFSLLSLAAILPGIVGPGALLTAGSIAYLQKQKVAKLYLVAWSSYLISITLFTVNVLGFEVFDFMPSQISTIMKGFSLLEITLLALALGEKYNAFRNDLLETQRKFTKSLEVTVAKRTEELNETLVEVKRANRLITDSIVYATRIQESILPTQTVLNSILPNSFVIWEPCHIVGGDFYVVDQFEEGIMIGVIDCTGHGVPGAFMTMVTYSAYQDLTFNEGCRSPAELLNGLNQRIKKILKQDQLDGLVDDGFDGGFCFINTKEKTISYAGAKHQLFCSDGQEIDVLKGDKASVGYKRKKEGFSFTEKTLPMVKGHLYYLLTDGFLDQLGEQSGFSFGSKRLKKAIDEAYSLPLGEQKSLFQSRMADHQGKRDRTDDITMIAFAADEFL